MAESTISFDVPAGNGVFTIRYLGSALALFSSPFHAALSIASFPSVPIWALTQAIVHFCVYQDMFSSASAVFKAIFYLKLTFFSA